MQRVLIGRVASTSGAVAVVVGTFLPWLRSGTRQRTSYEIFSLVERLGFSRSDVVGWGLRLWPVLPFLVVCAVTLTWFPRPWITGIASMLAAIYAGGVSAAVRSASPGGNISVEYGATITLVGAALMAAGYLFTSARRRATRAPRAEWAGGRS